MWADDDGNVPWSDQCVSEADVAESNAIYAAVDRIQGWLVRIGDGRIPVPFDRMDSSKAVPLASYLADHLGHADREWPEETAARKQRELREAEKDAARALARVAALRPRTTTEED